MSDPDAKLDTPKNSWAATQPARKLSDIPSFAPSSFASSVSLPDAPLEREVPIASPRSSDGITLTRGTLSARMGLLSHPNVDVGGNNPAIHGNSHPESSARARPSHGRMSTMTAPRANVLTDANTVIGDAISTPASSGRRSPSRGNGLSTVASHTVLVGSTSAANDITSNLDSHEFMGAAHRTASSPIAPVDTCKGANDAESIPASSRRMRASHGSKSSVFSPPSVTTDTTPASMGVMRTSHASVPSTISSPTMSAGTTNPATDANSNPSLFDLMSPSRGSQPSTPALSPTGAADITYTANHTTSNPPSPDFTGALDVTASFPTTVTDTNIGADSNPTISGLTRASGATKIDSDANSYTTPLGLIRASPESCLSTATATPAGATYATNATGDTNMDPGLVGFLRASHDTALSNTVAASATIGANDTNSNPALSGLSEASRDSKPSTTLSSANVAALTIKQSGDTNSNPTSSELISVSSGSRQSTMAPPACTTAKDVSSNPVPSEFRRTSHTTGISPIVVAASRIDVNDDSSNPALPGLTRASYSSTSKASVSSTDKRVAPTKTVEDANSNPTSSVLISPSRGSWTNTTALSRTVAAHTTYAGLDTTSNPASPEFVGASDEATPFPTEAVHPNMGAKTVEDAKSNTDTALPPNMWSRTSKNATNTGSSARTRQTRGSTKNATKADSQKNTQPQPTRSSASTGTSNLSDDTLMRRWVKAGKESQFRPTLTESSDLHVPDSTRDLLEKYEPVPHSVRATLYNPRPNNPDASVASSSSSRPGGRDHFDPPLRARPVPPLSSFSSRTRDAGTFTSLQVHSLISHAEPRARSLSSRAEPRARSLSLRAELQGRSLSSRAEPQVPRVCRTGSPQPRSPVPRPRPPLVGSDTSLHLPQWSPARSWEPPLRSHSTFLALDRRYQWDNAVSLGCSTPSGPSVPSSRVGSNPVSGRRHYGHGGLVFGSSPWSSHMDYGSSAPGQADIAEGRRRSDEDQAFDTPAPAVRRGIISTALQEGRRDAVNAEEEEVVGGPAERGASRKLSNAERSLSGRIRTTRDSQDGGFPDKHGVLDGWGVTESRGPVRGATTADMGYAHGDVSKYRDDIDAALQVNEDTMWKISQLELIMRRNRAEWEQKEGAFLQHADGLNKKLEHAEGRISTLLLSNHQRAQRAEDVEQHVLELEATKGAMERDIARLKQELHDATLQDSSVQVLQEELATVHERGVTAHREVEKRARVAEDKVLQWEHKADSSDWELAQANNAIESMQRELRELHAECGQASTVAAQKYALEENVAEMTSEFRDMKRDVQAERAHLGAMQRELEDTQRDYNRAEQEAAKHARALDEANKHVRYLKSELQQSAEQCSYQEVEIQRVTDQLVEQRTRWNEDMRHARSGHFGPPQIPPKPSGFHIDVGRAKQHPAALENPHLHCPPPPVSPPSVSARHPILTTHAPSDADLFSPHRGINGYHHNKVQLYISSHDRSESPPTCPSHFLRSTPHAGTNDTDRGIRHLPRGSVGAGRHEEWDDSPPSRHLSPTPSQRRPTTLGPYGQFHREDIQEKPISRGRSRAPYAEHYQSTPHDSARSRGKNALAQLVDQLAMKDTARQSTEQQLTALNKERELIYAALLKFPENSIGRTIQERHKKTECEARLQEVERQIAQLRAVLKNVKLLKPYRN